MSRRRRWGLGRSRGGGGRGEQGLGDARRGQEVGACVHRRQVQLMDPLRELGDEDVRTAIKNSSGVAGRGRWGGK